MICGLYACPAQVSEIAFTAIFFTAKNVIALQVAEILCGIPWGVFQTLTITYASEVCPVALRGYLTTYVNFCWGLGQVVGIGVIKSVGVIPTVINLVDTALRVTMRIDAPKLRIGF